MPYAGISAATLGDAVAGLSDGRLTTQSLTPWQSVNSTGATTVYYSPAVGNVIALWDGSKWVPVEFSEVSIGGPWTAWTPYDIYGYLDGGSLALEKVAWASDTARATQISWGSDGVLVKTGDATRRYLGTVYSSGSSTIEDHDTQRFVWNFRHQIEKTLSLVDSTGHSYTTSTWRAWNNNANNYVDTVCGLGQTAVFHVESLQVGGTGYTGLGINTSASGTSPYVRNFGSAYTQAGNAKSHALNPGRNYFYLTQYGTATDSFGQGGLNFDWRC